MAEHDSMYSRRDEDGIRTSPKAADVFHDWQGSNEHWLFVSAHDDDVVAGSGLLLLSALGEGIATDVLVTTDGRMGYCTEEQRETISEIRHGETEESFRLLGLPVEKIHFLGFPDGDLGNYGGRRVAKEGDPEIIEGHTGLENAYVYWLRIVRPNRIFVPTVADLHPDHKATNTSMLMSMFHACGPIWPELGEPLDGSPRVYEYATYCDFPELPQYKVETSAALLEKKMAGVAAYKSQKQIERAVEGLRESGPVEYIREIKFEVYSPANYKDLF